MVTSEIGRFETLFLEHLRTNHKNVIEEIRSTGKLSPENDKNLKTIIEAFLPASGLKMKA